MRTERNENGLAVLHLVDAAGGSEQLWGKERVVLWLMESQASEGAIRPRLVTLTPKHLTDVAASVGIASRSLLGTTTKNLFRYAQSLRDELRSSEPVVVHSHGYKANLVARLARQMGAPMLGLVSTCHGWVETSASLRLYNWLDRRTSWMSDVVTVPSELMLARLPRTAIAIPNGIPDVSATSPGHREVLRERFGIRVDDVVAGVIGRLSPEKGIEELLSAVRRSESDGVVWAVAGTGPMESELRDAAWQCRNLRWIGYVAGSQEFLPAIDVFVQPSRTEGLSLSLLEACRAGVAIVATRVGATEWAVRDGCEAVLIEPGSGEVLADAVVRLARDGALRKRLGQEARRRFEESLQIGVMQRRYAEIYEGVVKGCAVDRGRVCVG